MANWEFAISMKREELIHRAIIDYLKIVAPMNHFYYFHPASGEKRDPRDGAKLKRMAVIPGVADIAIIPPGARICWLEVKSEKGVLSPAQKGFQKAMDALGSKYAVVRSVDDAERVLKEWGVVGKRAA